VGDAFRILIVDDSPEDRDAYKRFLRTDRDHAYEFFDADTGEQGLRRAREVHPHCVLLDYRLPDVDGLSFLTQLNRGHDTPQVALIVLTGQGSEAVAVEAMKNGAQDYLLKSSISPATLGRSVQNAIEKVNLLSRIRQRTDELARANAELQHEIEQRRRAESALQHTYAELEELVSARTAELERANRELSIEVSERRRVEEERAQILVREQHANRLKDEFLATVSHELRTPLNAVLGWARVLRSTNASPALHARALQSIERNAQTQARLIEDLLEVSRIVTGKLRLKVRTIDLAQVVDAAVDVVRPAAEAKEIRVAREIAVRPWMAFGDPDRLQQIVWNLVSNAVKFTPRHGTVRVALVREDGWDHIVVTDSGKGIDPSFLPHVFAPFRQADASTTRDQGGLGLGLAIVRQLAELHGGSVRAESSGADTGATFTVTLPVHEMTAPAAADPVETAGRPTVRDPGASMPDLSGVRVMVVDDDGDARDLIAATLGYYGADVTAADSASEALALLPEVKPDVLLSDIGMTGEDGYSFIRRIRAMPAASGGLVPAVAVTAYAAAKDRARSLSSGFQLHISKPFDPIDLARVVQRLVGTAAG
jgi:signal transduction histidine kinase